ncbi:hypothetical protein [Bradyrhizobium sp. 141]|uniref:hypothetical protein n=1 Tax=Bradyrhizobium sp. 141 TaxID=2782617 RepID=UPI001FF7D88D|nr:hypothetical protein [Bradyrhizobium sp. 141]
MATKPKRTSTGRTYENAVARQKSVRKPSRPDLPRAAYSISEFCEAHRICEAFYYKLRAAGLGPREMRILGKVTISIEAALEWRRARENAGE